MMAWAKLNCILMIKENELFSFFFFSSQNFLTYSLCFYWVTETLSCQHMFTRHFVSPKLPLLYLDYNSTETQKKFVFSLFRLLFWLKCNHITLKSKGNNQCLENCPWVIPLCISACSWWLVWFSVFSCSPDIASWSIFCSLSSLSCRSILFCLARSSFIASFSCSCRAISWGGKY